MKTLTLEAEGGSLLLEIARNGWCSCFLLTPERRFLGADVFSVVAECLLAALADEKIAPNDELDGFSVRCALSLSEAHHVLYVADDGAARLFFWQDAGVSPPRTVGVLRLSPTQRRQWKTHLTSFSAPRPVAV